MKTGIITLLSKRCVIATRVTQRQVLNIEQIKKCAFSVRSCSRCWKVKDPAVQRDVPASLSYPLIDLIKNSCIAIFVCEPRTFYD